MAALLVRTARRATARRAARSLHGFSSEATRSLQLVYAHAGGEPAGVVTGGLPPIEGSTIREQLRTFSTRHDGLRKLLLTEPRGYPCQNVNFVLPSLRPDAAFGVLIAEQAAIYPAMSGHNTLCTATVLLETGMVPMAPDGQLTEFALDLPAGLVRVEARCRAGKAERITLRNAPSYVRPADRDVLLQVPHLGPVTVDIAYGGMHYVVCDAAPLGLDLTPANGREICRLGEMIKAAAREQHPVSHPEIDYPGPDILVFRGAPAAPAAAAAAAAAVPAAAPTAAAAPVELPALHGRNAVVMSNGTLDWEQPSTWTAMLDRSPCGTGTCAVMALLHARGELALHQDFVHESIVGSTFVGRLHEETLVGRGTADEVRAVVPTIAGRAWLTAHANVVCDPTDPFQEGFTVGDIWAS